MYKLYNVWVGGVLDAEGVGPLKAQQVHDEWVDKGYDDVIIEKLSKKPKLTKIYNKPK